MNKSELIDALSSKANITKASAGKVLDVLLEEVMTTVAQGDAVSLIGFGTFKQSDRAAREGKNPKTGEKILIPAATVPKFTAGSVFKDRVSGKK
jgi:DNA-binding protein HU-beta